MMKQGIKFVLPYYLIVLLFNQSCAPVNSSFESARMLREGEFEIVGSYSTYHDPDPVNENYGGRIGYGFSEKFNLKIRYERLIPYGWGEDFGMHYMDISPKFSILKNHISLILPVGTYLDMQKDPTFVFSPKFLFTYPATKKFDATIGMKSDFFYNDGLSYMLGLTAGFGISKDINNWALRPETGIMFAPGEEGILHTYGVAFQYIFEKKKDYSQYRLN